MKVWCDLIGLVIFSQSLIYTLPSHPLNPIIDVHLGWAPFLLEDYLKNENLRFSF